MENMTFFFCKNVFLKNILRVGWGVVCFGLFYIILYNIKNNNTLLVGVGGALVKGGGR